MPDTFRVLVTGARSVTDDGTALIRAKLRMACASRLPSSIVIVQGKCPSGGADRVAEDFPVEHRLNIEAHWAQWSKLGTKAGPMRNAEMVAAGADICLAFPDSASRGTWDCIRKAADAGIPVRIYPLGPRRA